jgi:hypothetical protein
VRRGGGARRVRIHGTCATGARRFAIALSLIMRIALRRREPYEPTASCTSRMMPITSATRPIATPIGELHRVRVDVVFDGVVVCGADMSVLGDGARMHVAADY